MEKYIIDSFIKRHGKAIFNNIKTMIQNEIEYSKSNIIFDDEYLSYIFEIATYEYCGIETEKIPSFISRMGNKYIPNIPYSKISTTHKNSINTIKNYLEQGSADIIELLNSEK